MHSDCFALFTRECVLEDLLDRLWILAAWRNPWRGAPNFYLPDKTRVTMVFLESAEKLGMPKLKRLPPEIIDAIHSYSERSLFCRYVSVLSLVRELDREASRDTLSLPLRQVLTWERGGQLARMAGSADLPIVRLTIDSRGIKEVERLPRQPPQSTQRTDTMVFVIQEESQLEGVIVHVKVLQTRRIPTITNI